jgi:hypothetical protein
MMMHDDEALHSWFIFNLHTKSPLYLHDTQLIVNQKTPLQNRREQPQFTWKSDVLLMVVNPYPPWSLA